MICFHLSLHYDGTLPLESWPYRRSFALFFLFLISVFSPMCCISSPSVSLCCHSNSLERRGERGREIRLERRWVEGKETLLEKVERRELLVPSFSFIFIYIFSPSQLFRLWSIDFWLIGPVCRRAPYLFPLFFICDRDFAKKRIDLLIYLLFVYSFYFICPGLSVYARAFNAHMLECRSSAEPAWPDGARRRHARRSDAARILSSKFIRCTKQKRLFCVFGPLGVDEMMRGVTIINAQILSKH